MNVCDLGHIEHDTIEVPTRQGNFEVFDTAKYMGAAGHYCTGQDVLSQNLTIEGQWEPHDSPVIEAVLRAGDRTGAVIDFGSHIGWYTVMAAKLGYHVLAVDADAENLAVLRRNIVLHGVSHLVDTRHAWVDEKFTLPTFSGVELVKIDIEGCERHAVAACAPFINRVSHMYVEISPAFRGDYPQLVSYLTRAGFEAFWPDGTRFDDDYTLTQFNLRFSR